MPSDPNTIGALVRSTAVAGAAAAETLALQPATYHHGVEISTNMRWSDPNYYLHIDVRLNQSVLTTPEGAEWMLDRLLERVEESLLDLRDQLARKATEEAQALEAERSLLACEYEQILERIDTIGDDVGMVRPTHSELEAERRHLPQRIRGYERELANYRSRLVDCPISYGRSVERLRDEWSSIIAFRESHLEGARALADAGAIPPTDAKEIEARLAEARARLLELPLPVRGRGALREPPDPDLISRSIESTERKIESSSTRLRALQSGNASQYLVELEQLQAKRRTASDRLELLDQQLAKVKERLHGLDRMWIGGLRDVEASPPTSAGD